MLSADQQGSEALEVSSDKRSIDRLTALFFGAFTAREGKVDLGVINELFIARGTIIKNCGPDPEVYSLQEFIEPREVLLNSGVLTDFTEEELYDALRERGHKVT